MRHFIITTLVFLFFTTGTEAQININAIETIVASAVADHLFEGTILIAEDGEVKYHQSFGFKDFDKQIPIDNDTRFSIASITKMFTAILTLQLVEEGKFELTSSLDDLIPEFEIPNDSEITVHHLLLHISGLPNENDAIYLRTSTPRDFVQETLRNNPGTLNAFNYANIDFVLLGLIIEKFDNKSFKESLDDRILEKYSMNETGILSRDEYPDNYAYTFSFSTENERLPDPLLYIENYFSAGYMFSTAKDLFKIDQALYDDELLTKESRDLMFTSYSEYNYSGYSVWTYNYPFASTNPSIMERRGGILGANSVLIRMLDTNKTIIILSNNNKFNPDSFGSMQNLKEALIIEMDRLSN